MPWWVWSLLGWIPLTMVVAAYWWAPRWPEVKHELARDRAARARRPRHAGPFHCLARRDIESRHWIDGPLSE
jgi:hypothetical protein